MSIGTLMQGSHLLRLLDERKVTSKRLQKLFDSGLLNDLFDVEDPKTVNRYEFRTLIGVNTISIKAEPLVYQGWKKLGHVVPFDSWVWNSAEVELWVPKNNLYEYVSNRVMNANVLQFLRKHQFSIPKEWRAHRQIHFRGTVFMTDADYHLSSCRVFQALKWVETRDIWEIENLPLDRPLDPEIPVALFKS
jgi:hypothetical protein